MESYNAKKLPIEYNFDKELLKLVSEANEKYGEYKTLLNNVEFDSTMFLDSILLSESLKSSQIEGTRISQDEMYYLKYNEKNDDNLEIKNLKDAINYASLKLSENKTINLNLINEMHKILLKSVRGFAKEPGNIRTVQNWIGPTNCSIDDADFVPPKPEELYGLLENLFNYMNDEFIDPKFINLAISHFQFETIHAYRDGNGRLGRALIPIQLSVLTGDEPILFLSEVIEIYKPSYYKLLNESRRGNLLGFIKFFLQCIIEQCNAYIYKLKKIKQIFNEDMKEVECIKGASIYKIMPVIMKQVVFTKKEVQLESGVSINVTSNIINKLVDIGILVKDDTVVKKGFKYKRIYDVFVGKENN